MLLNTMAKDAHENSKAHGFWEGQDERFIPEKLALIHAEASEALEDFRDGKMQVYYEPKSPLDKPCGFPSELADIIIRVGDLAGYLNIDLEKAVSEKMAYNATRPYKHGGKKA